ncbi:RNA-binding ribosome biosynthesis protein mak21 [Spiromyces aspiralis]|uniref:RNA-binding ribosome biosynthesis protein mak21 n=1 Tax=Spiromyces aspiralis TaxID=68401 RepID=A0ACC1HH08_9FUNG|nr:RNA-binding ribosome biosynthesis protein mak21 [Spiromyces aspiralis]
MAVKKVKNKAPSRPTKNKSKEKNGDIDDRQLLNEIEKLGGSKQDLDLINGKSKKSKDSFDKPHCLTAREFGVIQGKFNSDFAKLIKQIGLNEKAGGAASDKGNSRDIGGPTSTKASVMTPKKKSNKNHGEKNLFPPDSRWYALKLPELDPNIPFEQADEKTISSKLEVAKRLLEQENGGHSGADAHKSLSTSDQAFVSNIIKSGILSDRVSGLTLLVQESPIHAVTQLEQLMSMARKKNRREALMAVSSLKDLMISNLLPDRKLRFFVDQPLNHPQVKPEHLLLWYFENMLKKHYFELIQIMETLSYDSVIHTKHNMLVFIESLLESKPEQEQSLLRLLVNKLGDKEKQVASKASYLILKLLNAHPNMKQVVVKTVQELLLTRNIPHQRSLYYTIITLNQIILSSKDTHTANLLIGLYFTFFRKIFFPEDSAKSGDEEAEDEEPEVKRKGKDRPPRKIYFGQKAMKKAKAEAELAQKLESRSLDNKLMAALLSGVNRALPFSEIDAQELDKYIDMLFKVIHCANFNSVVQALALLYQLSQKHATIINRYYRALYGSLLDPRIETTSKQAMYLNLLFKSLKSEPNPVRMLAFVKRLLQIAGYHQPSFVCGLLYMLSQLAHSNEIVKLFFARADEPAKPSADTKEGTETLTAGAEDCEAYDSAKRDPRFARAEHSCCWELSVLLNHFHPSVARLVRKLLDHEAINEAPNLHLHSLSHFLERFVYRNPKMKEGPQYRGQSLMQPLIDTKGAQQAIISKKPVGLSESKRFDPEKLASMSVEEVPEDERFFHKFFQMKKDKGLFDRNKGKKKGGKKSKGDDSEDEDVDAMIDKDAMAEDSTGFAAALMGRDEPFAGSSDDDEELDEDEVWKAMKDNMPEDLEEGLGSDIDLDDYDEDEFAALGDSDDNGEKEDGDSHEQDEAASDCEDGSDDEGFDALLAVGEYSDDDSNDDNEETANEEEMVIKKPVSKKREGPATEDGKGGSKKRRKRDKLPMIASFEDYEHLINNDEGLT